MAEYRMNKFDYGTDTFIFEDERLIGMNLIPLSKNLESFTHEDDSRLTVIHNFDDCVVTNTYASSSVKYGIYYDVDVVSNETYSLSFNISSKSGSAFFAIGNRTSGQSASWTNVVNYVALVVGQNTKTFTIPSGMTRIRIYICAQYQNSTFTISKIKLERGATVTEWTPFWIETSDGGIKTYSIRDPQGTLTEILSTVTDTDIKAVNSSLTTSSTDDDWLKALLVAICKKYPNKSGHVFKGKLTPNSSGIYKIYIYNTSTVDSTTKLPQHSFGLFRKWGQTYKTFSTSSYVFTCSDVNTNTWRGIQDNLTSTSTTDSLSANQGRVLDTNKINKSIGTTKGDILYWSGASTPTRLGIGSNGKVLKVVSGVPAWADDSNTTYTAGTGLSLSGTTFNHSNSVTAGTAGTSSATSGTTTLAVPYVTYDAQGHITGSGTHTHTISSFPEAYLTWGGKSFSGDYAPIDAALVPELGANRLAFLDPSRIQIEYSRNGGTDWYDYGATNSQKLGLFSEVGTSLQIGKADSSNKATNQFLLRVTLNFYPSDTIPNVYTVLNKFVIYVSTNSNSGCYVLIDHALKSSETTYTLVEPYSCDATTKRTPLSGWSGYNVINFPSFTTYGNSSAQSWQYSKVRFTFGCTGGTGTQSNGFTILKILGFGGVGWGTPSTLAKYNRIYTYDVFQNTTFPGKVTATQFLGDKNLLRWQTTTLSPQNIYDFGVFVGQGDNGIVGPSGSHYYTMLNLPYTAEKRDAPHWAMSIAGSTSKDNRLFFRTSSDTEWQSWQQVAHIAANTTVGSNTQPVYVSANGFLTAGLDYKDFTIDIRQGSGTPITQNSNLDTDYNEPGTYKSGYSGITNSLTGIGSPITESGFKLFTIGGYSSNLTDSTKVQTTQILISNTKTDFFLRGRNNDGNGWSNWHKLVTISANDSDKKTFTITDNAISRFNGTTGKIQNSTATIDDNGNLSLFGTLYLNRYSGVNYGRISYYFPSFKSWFTYMSNPAAGTAPTGGQPSTLGNVTSYALRHLIEPNSGYGWIWETAANAAAASTSTKTTPRMSLSANTGQLWIAPNAASDTVGSSGLIIDTSANGGKGTAAIELYRGDPNGSIPASCSWQIANIEGKLHFKDNWASGALTTYQNDQLILNYNTGNVEIVKGSLYFNATSVGRSIYFKDKKSTIFPAIRYNGANLWIGGEGNLAHQVGQTFISAGYQSDEVTSNRSIVVALPQKEGTTVSYSSYYVPYITQANSVKANYLMYFTKTDGAGITPFTTIKRTFTSQIGLTPAHDNILFDQEGEATFKTTRKSGTSGGWAVAPIRFINGKDSTGQNENNDTYFYMGAFGTGFTLRYAFLGPQFYEGTKNLRIYPDGKVTSLSFETSSANIGTLNVEDSFYANDINAGNLIVNGSGTFVQKVTASQYTGSGVINHTTGPLGWESSTGNGLKIPTLNTIAYWNGCYNNDSSNLKYGRVGSQTIQFGNAIGRTVLETQLTSNTSDNNKLPTASAIKNSLGYVTPQMFGAKGNGIDDDSNAFQAALDAAFNVYIPEGKYLISHPLIVRSGTHLHGVSAGKSILLVDKNNFSIDRFPTTASVLDTPELPNINTYRKQFLQEEATGNYVIQIIECIRASHNYYSNSQNTTLVRPAFTTDLSNFILEDFSINCNHSRNNGSKVAVGGLHLFRPYNKCSVRNVYVDNCTCRAIMVGDEVSTEYMQAHYNLWIKEEKLDPTDEGSITKMLRRRTRSQTLVIDNCQFMGSKTGQNFSTSKYYKYNSTTGLVESSTSTSGGYASYNYVFWRPHFLEDYTWKSLAATAPSAVTTTFDQPHIAYMTSTSTWPKFPDGTVATSQRTAEEIANDFQSQYYGKYTTDVYKFHYDHGSEPLNVETGDQGYVNKRQLGGNVWLSYQTDSLAYFYNSFELNLKDTKIMFSGSNFKSHPCAVFYNCTDVYTRGCSFTGTLGEAVRIVGPTKYFRFIGNTYEVCGVVLDDNGAKTGNGFATMGIHNLYKSANESTNLYPQASYIINCQGLYSNTDTAANKAKNSPYQNPVSAGRQVVANGIIIETTYDNTPRQVKLTNTNDILIMGSFTKAADGSDNDTGTFLLDNINGHIKTDKFSTQGFQQYYSLTISTNQTFGPFTKYASKTISPPDNMAPIGSAVITSEGSVRPALVWFTKINDGTNNYTMHVRTTGGSGNIALGVRVTFGVI